MTPTQVFSREYCQIFKNFYFEKQLRMAASTYCKQHCATARAYAERKLLFKLLMWLFVESRNLQFEFLLFQKNCNWIYPKLPLDFDSSMSENCLTFWRLNINNNVLKKHGKYQRLSLNSRTLPKKLSKDEKWFLNYSQGKISSGKETFDSH